MFIVIAALFGAIAGSFLNMLIFRVPRNLSLTKRSSCPRCGVTLRWYQLFPIISFVCLRGRCAQCKSPVGWRYLFCELVMSGLFSLYAWQYGWSMAFVAVAIFSTVMVLLFWIDWEHFLLPIQITVPLIFCGLLRNSYEKIWIYILSAIAGYGIIWIINWLGKVYYKRDVLGGGDMLLLAAVGAWWGWETMLATVYIAFLLGGLLGVLLIVSGVKRREDHMPFGPAIVLGWFLAQQAISAALITL